MNEANISNIPVLILIAVTTIVSIFALIQLFRLKSGMEKGAAGASGEKEALAAANAEIAQFKSQLEDKKQEITELKSKLEQEVQQRLSLAEKLGRSESTLDSERSANKEKLDLLSQAQERLKTEFENTANKILEEKSEKFTTKNKSNIESILNPLKDQLKDFKTKVEETYDKESKMRFSLEKEIKDLKSMNQQLSTEASNLVSALKGNSKTQGNWGELILERVLEESGLQAGREYETQGSFTQEDGKRKQPDVIVHLPEGKSIIVDAKVSLLAYERYCSEEGDEQKAQALREHVSSVKKHVKDLSAKKYEDIDQIKSLDFILMFMPIEAAFNVAMEKDQNLYQDAIDQNIFIVSPSNLLVMLRTIGNIWRYDKQNQNAKVIAEKAGNLFDKFVGLLSDLDNLGKKIDGSQQAYHSAMKKLSTGSGNIIKRVDDLKKLGAKTNKDLPKELLESSDDYDGASPERLEESSEQVEKKH